MLSRALLFLNPHAGFACWSELGKRPVQTEPYKRLEARLLQTLRPIIIYHPYLQRVDTTCAFWKWQQKTHSSCRRLRVACISPAHRYPGSGGAVFRRQWDAWCIMMHMMYICVYVCVCHVYIIIYIHVRVRNPSWGFCAGCITMHHYALKRCQWFEKLDQTSFLLQSGPCSRKPSGHLLHISKGTWNHETKLRPPLNPHPRIHYPLLHP